MANYQPQDKYFRKAKDQGFRARSIYKLEEIDQQLHLFEPQMRVLDLGAYPGSWTQYTAPKVKEIVAVDLKEIDPFDEPNVIIKVGNALQKEYEGKFDVILSDMSPKTSGIKYRDQKRIIQLNRGVFNLARSYLKPNGRVVSKIFQGIGFDKLVRDLKTKTRWLKIMEVKASRPGSTERYLIYSLKD